MQQQLDPRLTMARLPDRLQVALSLMIGKPLPGQELPRLNAFHQMAFFVALHLVGIALSLLAVIAGGWAWAVLPVGYYFLVAGARHLQVGGIHHMTHGNFTGNQKWDDWIGRFLSLYLLIEEYDTYRRGHLKHHSNALSTEDDPTVRTLRAAGLLNGMSVKALKARLLRTVLSPAYHLRSACSRIMSHYRARETWKPVAVTVYLVSWLGVIWLYPAPATLGWVLPMIVGYQSVVVVRSIVEHWPERINAPGGLQGHAEKTSAIYCARPLPAKTGRRLADIWILARWSVQMVFEIGCRYLFVCADGPNHDIHHLYPRSSWPNHAALRAPVQAELSRRGHEGLSESWGFLNTLQLCLQAMSEADGERGC